MTRSVALWVSEPFDQQASEAVAEFIRRTELSASIDHPSVMQVIDVGRAHGRVYFVTPPVEGVTFDELLRREAPLAPDDAIALLAGVADGLDTAHAAGLVHGALSPTTLWVTPANGDGPQASIVGFGLEALLRAQARGNRQEQLLDEVLYIAPERLRGETDPDGRADQYALACALYHCVAGRPPFVRDRLSSLFGAHMLAHPEPLMSGDGNSAFGNALSTGMAKDAGQRFESCRALLEIASGGGAMLGAPHAGAIAGDHSATNGAPQTESGAGGDTASPAEVIEDPRRGDRTPPVVTRPGPVTTELVSTPVPEQAPAPPRRSRRTTVLAVVGLVLLAVLAGALVSVSILRDTPGQDDEAADAEDDADADGGAAPARRQVAASTATGDANAEDAGTVVWQRDIGDEAVTQLEISGENAVAATGNDLTVVNPLTGSRRWRKVADFGILTDLVTVGDVVVYRSDVLSGVSLPFGTQLWENARAETPTGALTSGGDDVYAVGPGEVFPEMVSVDPATGEERWHFHGQQIKVEADASVSTVGDIVIILQRGEMFGVDPDRKLVPSGTELGRVEIENEKWRVDDIGGAWPDTLTTTEDDAAFAMMDGDVCVYALDDGERRWCVQVRGVRDASPGLAVEGDLVLVATRDEVVALDLATGDERWRTEETEAPFLPMLAVTEGSVTVPDESGTVQTFAMRDGAPQWHVDGFGEVSVMTSSEGGVVLGNEEGRLARVEPPGSAGS